MDAHCDWNGIIAGMADDKCFTCNCRQTHTHYQLTIVINIIIIIATSSLDTTYDMEGKVDKRTERDRWRYVDDKTKNLCDRQVRRLLRLLLEIWIRSNCTIIYSLPHQPHYPSQWYKTRVSYFITFNLVPFPKPQTKDWWWSACL